MARWLSAPALSGIEGRHGSWHFVPVLRVSETDLGDGRHDFSGHAQAARDVVSGHVVCDEPEERSQRTGLAEGAGAA